MAWEPPAESLDKSWEPPKDALEEPGKKEKPAWYSLKDVNPTQIGADLNLAAGGLVQGEAYLGEQISGGSVPRGPQPKETYGLPQPGAPAGIPKLAPPEVSQKSVDDFRRSEAARFQHGLEVNPMYKMGQYMEETGQQAPEPETPTGKGLRYAAGVLGPAVSGPVAPGVVYAQSKAATYSEEYAKNKAKGMSDGDAALDASETAEKVGLTQAILWEIMPKLGNKAANKVTSKLALGGLGKFAARRVGGAGVVGATAAAAKASENLETGKPLLQDVGKSAIGGAVAGALTPQPGINKFKPREEVPTPAPPKQLNAPPVTPVHIGPEGAAMSRERWENLSPVEQKEWMRDQESLSRQSESGRQRVINTIDAALRKGDSPIGWNFKEQGANWFKEDGRWRTSQPSKSFAVQQLDPANPAHAEVVAKLERRLRGKTEQELRKMGDMSGLKQKIEDITGVSRAKTSVAEHGPEVASREIWEKLWNQRFAVPLADYGKNGEMSGVQENFLRTFPDMLSKMDKEQVQRLYATFTGGLEKPFYRMGTGFTGGGPRWKTVAVKPQGTFEQAVFRAIQEHLGIAPIPAEQTKIGGKALPQLQEGGQNAPNQEQKPGGVPPERGGDGSGGPPAEASPGGVVPPAAPVEPKAPETKVAAGFDYETVLAKLRAIKSIPDARERDSQLKKFIEADPDLKNVRIDTPLQKQFPILFAAQDAHPLSEQLKSVASAISGAKKPKTPETPQPAKGDVVPSSEEAYKKLYFDKKSSGSNIRDEQWSVGKAHMKPDGTLYEPVSGEIGEQYDAHGVAKGNELANLKIILSNGIDPSKPIYTAPFDAPSDVKSGLGAGLGTGDGTAYKDGIAVITGERGKSLKDGIRHVFVNDAVADILPSLKKEFPQYDFHLLSEQKAVLEGKPDAPSSPVKPPDVHGGSEAGLTPEQRAKSRQNNSREAFEALAKKQVAENTAKESGWTFSDKGVASGEGATPEKAAEFKKYAWEFTDRRPGSPSEGVTIYLPEGSSREEIQKAIKEKLLELAKGTAEKAAEDEVKRQRKLAEDLMREKFSNEHDYAQAFPEARYTWDQMVKEVERGLKLGKSEEEIRKAFNPANGMTSHPDRLINKVNSVPSDPEKLVAAREGRTKTPSEIAAEEAKAAGKKPTEEETDYAKWKQAESDKPILMAQLRHGTTADGRALTAAEKEALPGKIAEANKVLEAMGKKYNEPSKSFGKYMAKKSGTPGLPKDTTPRGEALNEDDRVVGTVDGKEEVGIVRQFAGRLQVVSPDGSRVISENVVGFKKDARPTTPAASKSYEAADLRTAVKQYSKVKADFKINPSMEQEALAAINKLRADAASRGVDPDSPAMNSETEAHKIRMIQETVADAAKYRHFLDKGHKNYTEAGNAEKLDTVRKWLDNANKPTDPTFRQKAEEINKKLDQLKANKKPSELALFGVTQKLWDVGIEAAKTAIRAGGSTLDAIAAAARYIRSQIGNAWKEFDFKKWLGEQFPAREGEEAPAKKDFIKTWITDSVAPSVRGTHDATKAAINLFVDWFAPTTKAASGDLDTLMESKGYKDKLMLRAAHALSQAREAMGGMKRKDQIDFVDRVKRGKAQPTPELQATADLLRKWDDRLYALASKYSPDLPYLANHLRVLWKVIPGTAGKSAYEIEQMMSKRPWRGSRGFILRHTLEDMSEGIEKGGVPVTYNPIEMFMLHAQDVTKFVSANRAWENLKDSGRAVFVERGDHPPDENWSRINDTIAKQYFKKVETTTEGGRKVTKPGEWYVNKDTARLINNYLSRDYVRENAAGRGLLAFKNISTAIELGASPFHAAFVTNESISSSMAMAINKGLRGDVRGAASSLWDAASGLKGPLGNIPGLPEPVRNALETRISKLGRLTSEYAKSPKEFEANYPQAFAWLNKNYPQFKGMVNDLFTGGGMVEMHDDYKVGAAQGFESAFKNNNYVTATAKAIPALNQFLLRPIFQEYIPRLKLGHFVKEYADALERRAGDLESGKITRAQLARETWAFVDDRFGELNWDNLYWNRSFKSANQLAFRSVTWKLGNIRGFGKGIRDAGQFAVDIARFKKPTLTNPMAWMFGMAAVTAIQSTILSKIFTKKYPWELAEDGYDLIKNLTFPRVDATDPSQRVSTPTYWKDAVHFIHSPYDYVRSSMTGEWGRLWDIWNNKDFYGTQIYNPDDPFWQRQEDKAIHLIPLPFSISSQLAAERSGSSKTVSHLGQAGFTKAPYYMSHTPAELEASELMQQQLPQGARTKENAEKAINVHKAVQAIKRGDMTLRQAMKQGLIDEKHFKQVDQMARQSYLVTQIKRSSMTPEDAIKIWHVANPKERKDIKLAVELKILHSRSTDPRDKIRLIHELDKNP